MISNLDYTNQFYKKIQTKVIKESESILETPRRDLDFELIDLEEKKKKYFSEKQIKYDQTVNNFIELLSEISIIIKEIKSSNDKKYLVKFIDLFKSSKLCLATTHMFNQHYDIGIGICDELIKEYPDYLRPHIKKLECYTIQSNFGEGFKEYSFIKNWSGGLNQADIQYKEKTLKAYMEAKEKDDIVN